MAKHNRVAPKLHSALGLIEHTANLRTERKRLGEAQKCRPNLQKWMNYDHMTKWQKILFGAWAGEIR